MLLDYHRKTRLSDKELQNIIINSLNHIIININNKTKNGDYPLLKAIDKNKIEIVKIFIEYANKNNIIIKFNNEKEKKNINYSLMYSIKQKRNIEIIKLFIEYANKNNIILELNKKR